MTEHSNVQLVTLGEVTARYLGRRVHLGTRKQMALLVYLAMNQGRFLRRDELAELLWEESGNDRARHSLSQAIYSIRKQLPSLMIDTTPHEIMLVEGPMMIDAAAFQQLLSAKQLEHAELVYRGDFLQGFWVDQAPLFEHWQEEVRARLRRLAEQMYWELLRNAEDSGRWTEAESLAGKLLSIDPFNETVHRIRITAIASSGDKGAAVREYNKFVRFIEEELGRRPETETNQLMERIAVLKVGEVTDEAGDEQSSDFVGREREFRSLQYTWRAASKGSGRLVAIVGEAGIGKTRLCGQFVQTVQLNGARTLVGRCYASDTQIPYSGITDCLLSGVEPYDLDALPAIWKSAIADLIPELVPWNQHTRPLDAPNREHARRRYYESISMLLKHMSVNKPLVMLMDDLQWADDSTAALLYYLARRLRNSAVLLLVAVRREDIPVGSPIWRILRNSVNAPYVHVQSVTELTESESLTLMKSQSQHLKLDVHQRVLDDIYRKVGGRPFLILEMMKALKQSTENTNSARQGTTGERSGIDGYSISVEELLGSRFLALSDGAYHTMAALSVVGKKAMVDLLAEVAGLTIGDLMLGVKELVKRGIVRTQGREVAFVHDLTREAGYGSLSGAVRRELHEKAADALQRRQQGPVGTLATHYDLAGISQLAYEYAIAAAVASERVYAQRETEFYLRMALANADDPLWNTIATERLATFFYRWSRYSDAEEFYKILETRYREENNERGLLAVEVNRACIEWQRATRPREDLLRWLEKLASTAQELGDYDTLSDILRKIAETAFNAGWHDVVLSTATRLLSTADSLRLGPQRVRAIGVAANILGIYHSVDEGKRHCERALREAELVNDPEEMLAAIRVRAKLRLLSGQIDDAEVDLLSALSIADKLALMEARQDIRITHAILHTERGTYNEAEAVLHDVLRIADEFNSHYEKESAWGNMLVVHWERRDVNTAKDLALKLLAVDFTTMTWWSTITAWSILGLCALERRQFTEAHQCRREVLLRSERRDSWVSDMSYAETFLARLAAAEGEVGKALERLDRVIRAYEGRDVLCRSRLQLERARLLEELDPVEAWRQASEVRDRVRDMGTRPLVQKADAIMDRLPEVERNRSGAVEAGIS